jgi:hypothetical protein
MLRPAAQAPCRRQQLSSNEAAESPALPRISVEPLREEHLTGLAVVLRHPAVYEHIGGEVSSLDDFVLGLTRALAGPPATRTEERWLHYLMRDARSGRMIGRLESTVVPGRAEVAFLLDPSVWGQGYASAGLAWLHGELARMAGPVECWATTMPSNIRCQSLLRRAGYSEVPASSAPPLASYEPGDLVFRRRAAA